MSFIDFPPPSKDILRFGVFVVVALDPAASLAVLDDEIVEAAARRLKTQKRLVLVDITLASEPGVAYYRYYPVGSGLPRTSWQSVPIEPATAHPEGRLPISCSKKLPIDDPHLHTMETFEGAISRIYMGQPSDIRCPDDDLSRLSRQYRRDMTRMYHELQGNRGDAALAVDSQGVPDGSPWEGFVQTFMRPNYQMWLHIDENESYADPSTLQDEIAELCAIETEWRERREAEVKAKKDRLQAWREDVNAPEAPQESGECDGSDLVPGDAIMLPEDAIEDLEDEAGVPKKRFDGHEPLHTMQNRDRAAPPQSAMLEAASDVGSTTSTVQRLSSAPIATSWTASARVWVPWAAKARLFGVLLALIPGEFW
ncbi:hypothetical protein AURDEDRAFT_171608 [Auricularia subglabra TFB-10046 SS5]|nr:hypothetical protein AURDEDRAFT_171608 [Auricularia subglabra TFB-10046 SS5]